MLHLVRIHKVELCLPLAIYRGILRLEPHEYKFTNNCLIFACSIFSLNKYKPIPFLRSIPLFHFFASAKPTKLPKKKPKFTNIEQNNQTWKWSIIILNSMFHWIWRDTKNTIQRKTNLHHVNSSKIINFPDYIKVKKFYLVNVPGWFIGLCQI